MRFRALGLAIGLALLAGCGSDGRADPAAVASEGTRSASSTTASAPAAGAPSTVGGTSSTAAPPAAALSRKCIVSLHGKGGGGQGERTGSDGIRHSFPAGNAAGWGGLQWLYYPQARYQAARDIVANDVAAGGCGRVIVYGFSNGAAFAAKLFCRGETFGGTVVGYVIDDPVVDHAVEGCARAPVRVVMYWTGDINVPDGWDCGDWTCEGGSAIGIARYEAAVGVRRTASIHNKHQQYSDPPEFHSWL